MIRRLIPALVLAACATAPTPVAAPVVVVEALRARDFYPLAVGHKWTYRLDSEGASTTRSVEITREDKGWFVDTGGGQLRVDARGVRDPDRYLLMDPLEKGHKWSNVLSVQSTERYEILDAGFPCEEPAGTFARCVKVRATQALDAGRSIVNELTYAEGVGLVELHSYAQAAGKPSREQMAMRLASYKLAN